MCFYSSSGYHTQPLDGLGRLQCLLRRHDVVSLAICASNLLLKLRYGIVDALLEGSEHVPCLLGCGFLRTHIGQYPYLEQVDKGHVVTALGQSDLPAA